MGEKQYKRNSFKLERVVNNLPGTSAYDFCQPWVYKERRNGSIAADLFVYVDGGQSIGTTEELFREASSKWGST